MTDGKTTVSDQHLASILDKIRVGRNIDLRNYKRATLKRRIERRIIDRKCSGVAEYNALLEREPQEFESLIASLFIKATRFFRDTEIWEFLKARVLPELIAAKRSKQVLRIWCAGCATGEEAFSVAMLVAEALGPALGAWDVKIFGTDADEGAIAFARRATYTPQQVEGVPKDVLGRWFLPAPEGFVIQKEIRRLVVFGVNNLVSDAPISRLDLVLCRNVFIYLDGELQKRVITRFHYSLRREGVLVLGRSELIPFAAKIFQPVDLSRRVYKKHDRKDLDLGMGAPQLIETMLGSPAPAAPPGAPSDIPLGAPQICQDILEALPVPVIVTSIDDEVKYWSGDAARIWGRGGDDVLGKNLASLGLAGLSGDLLIEKTAAVRSGHKLREVTDGVIMLPGRSEPTIVSVEVKPLRNAMKQVVGLLYILQDVTALRTLERDMRQVNGELREANERLQLANEELQAANEELETTNEELQSANEELQTTNEELQSANEELETTNEELQSTNVELDATNRELAHRTEEMNVLSFYHRTIIRSLSAAVVILDDHGRITLWNVAAERLLGLIEAEAVGQTFWTLRIPALRRVLVARMRKALREERAFRADNVEYDLPTGGQGYANVTAIPLVEGKTSMGAVVIFEDTTRLVKLAERRLQDKRKKAADLDAYLPAWADGQGASPRRARQGDGKARQVAPKKGGGASKKGGGASKLGLAGSPAALSSTGAAKKSTVQKEKVVG